MSYIADRRGLLCRSGSGALIFDSLDAFIQAVFRNSLAVCDVGEHAVAVSCGSDLDIISVYYARAVIADKLHIAEFTEMHALSCNIIKIVRVLHASGHSGRSQSAVTETALLFEIDSDLSEIIAVFRLSGNYQPELRAADRLIH